MSEYVPGAAPAFAVIIPTFRRPAQLGQCLTALSAQRYPQCRFEVVVVDDGGGDPLDEMLSDGPDTAHHGLRVRILRQSRAGAASARNAGAAATAAQYLAFIDDDCLPDPGWLEAFAHRLQTDASGHCLLGGRVVNGVSSNACAEASQLILDLAYAYHNPDPSNARFFASNNMAMAAARFRSVGGFDPSFRVASEDRDLCERWAEAGGHLAFVETAVIKHMNALTFGGFLRQHFSYGRGAWRFHAALRARHRGRLRRDIRFHTRFLAQARRRIAGIQGDRKLQLVGLLLVWQWANAAGFLYEALRSVSTKPAPV